MFQEATAAAAEHIAKTVVDKIQRAKLSSGSDGGWEEVGRSKEEEMDGSDGDGSESSSGASSREPCTKPQGPGKKPWQRKFLDTEAPQPPKLPPGIPSISKWGQTIIDHGRSYRGMTYEGAHADHPDYVKWCLRHRARFPDSEPFQDFVGYCQAKEWEQRSNGSEQQGKGHKSKDAPKKKEKSVRAAKEAHADTKPSSSTECR